VEVAASRCPGHDAIDNRGDLGLASAQERIAMTNDRTVELGLQFPVRDVEQQRSFYNTKWASFKGVNTFELRRITKVLEYLCEVPVRNEICDLGCGAGWTTAILGYFGRALGVELSDVDHQRRQYGHCEFVSADVLQWDCPDGIFDVVVSVEVIEHIPYSAQQTYLRVAHRLLRPGGHFILTTPNKRTMRAMPDARAWTNQPVEDWLGMAELLALVEGNGFEVLKKSSLILGQGQKGSYRLVNSCKVASIAKTLGLLGHLQSLFLSQNYGLHLAVLARRR
jgi:SAM-dependent methyltransferase